jgi:hypothetical protein
MNCFLIARCSAIFFNIIPRHESLRFSGLEHFLMWSKLSHHLVIDAVLQIITLGSCFYNLQGVAHAYGTDHLHACSPGLWHGLHLVGGSAPKPLAYICAMTVCVMTFYVQTFCVVTFNITKISMSSPD